MHLPHCVAIFYKLPWFCSTKVIYEKLQRNAENACRNRMCKRAFRVGNDKIESKVKSTQQFEEELEEQTTECVTDLV
jgi:hypothetical protein